MLYRNFSTQEEIDAQYDVESAVPDFPVRAQKIMADAEAARRNLSNTLGIKFGPSVDEYLDYFPTNIPNAPIVMFIHGGYWRILSAREFSHMAQGLTMRGLNVAVMNYSLCPKVTMDEITRQSRAATVWLYENGRQLGGDPEQLFVIGHSAGGQQVGMLLSTDWQQDYAQPAEILKGGVAISGLFDLSPFRYSWLQPKILLTHDAIRKQSPLFNLRRSNAPLVVTLGGDESEEFHRQSETYFEAWEKAGNTGRYFVQPGCDHFTAIAGLAVPDDPLTDIVVELAGQTGSTHPKAINGSSHNGGSKNFSTYGAPSKRLSFEK